MSIGSDYDFDQSICYWLTVTTQAVHRALDERLAPQGITYRQSQVIGWLARLGEATQSELAGRMMIEPSTLLRLLDRMEQARLVERIDCPSDRRRKLLRLRREAEPLWQRIAQTARELRAEAARGLSSAEQAQLRSLLQRILQNMEGCTPATKGALALQQLLGAPPSGADAGELTNSRGELAVASIRESSP